ncbi:MAG: hypothetical protein Q9170_002339 [Blastenia crenularia]
MSAYCPNPFDGPQAPHSPFERSMEQGITKPLQDLLSPLSSLDHHDRAFRYNTKTRKLHTRGGK